MKKLSYHEADIDCCAEVSCTGDTEYDVMQQAIKHAQGPDGLVNISPEILRMQISYCLR